MKKKEENFGKKAKQMKKIKKKHVGKVKAKFSTSSILKKKSTKIILKKKYGEKLQRNKNHMGNIVTIHSVLKKKTTK